MSELANFFTAFEGRRFIGYSYARLPNVLDLEIEQAIRWFMNQPLDERERVSSTIGPSQAETLLRYGVRMATLSVRRNEPRYIELALIGLSLAQIQDRRYLLMALSLPYHSALKLGEDPQRFFTGAANLTTGAGRELLLAYASRDRNSKDIDVMGFAESSDLDGFVYKSTL